MKEQLLFQLSEPLTISKNGGLEETSTIIVDPPSMKAFKEVTRFQQLFMGSFVSAGNLIKNSADKQLEEVDDDFNPMEELKKHTPSPQDIIMMISMSQEIKIEDLFFAFKKLMVQTAKVDDNIRMKESHFDHMDIEDVMRFIAEYAHFFTFPSLLGGQQVKKNGSEISAD